MVEVEAVGVVGGCLVVDGLSADPAWFIFVLALCSEILFEFFVSAGEFSFCHGMSEPPVVVPGVVVVVACIKKPPQRTSYQLQALRRHKKAHLSLSPPKYNDRCTWEVATFYALHLWLYFSMVVAIFCQGCGGVLAGRV